MNRASNNFFETGLEQGSFQHLLMPGYVNQNKDRHV